MAAATGLASLKAGLMIAAPVLAVAAPLVLAALFLRPEGAPVHPARASAHLSPKTAVRPTSVLMPAVAASPAQVASQSGKARAKGIVTAKAASERGARAQRPARAAAFLTRAATGGGLLGCSTDGVQGLACGGAPAVRSAIQAQLSYNRLNTNCASLRSAYSRGGLEGSLIYAMNGAQVSARRAGLTGQAEEAQVKRALQQALVVSGSAPRDVLTALADLEAVYGGCDGYDSARNALLGTASLVQSQLGFDQPTATVGFGAAFANPGLPSAGAVGTASYSAVLVGP